MARTILKTKDKIYIEHNVVLCLVDDFINDSFSGRRTRSDGKRIALSTIETYENFKRIIIDFCKHSKFQLRVYIYDNLTPPQRERATKWYMRFYRELTNYLYDELNHFDNYVGTIVKTLRTFYRYIEKDRYVSIGNNLRYFYVPQDYVPIIALRLEQLKFIIHSRELDSKLDEKLKEVRDIFVFGCTVALRISDLMSLTKRNLKRVKNDYYLNVKSFKTNTETSIKLPPYAIEILLRYQEKHPTLLPPISKGYLNIKLKEFAAFLPENFEIPKVREKRGKPVLIYKDPETKTHYHLSDHICTHTMRRTAITTMLTLGMSEHMVRQISGHAPNSKEFYRYVQISQSYLNQETDKIFDQLCNWNPFTEDYKE